MYKFQELPCCGRIRARKERYRLRKSKSSCSPCSLSYAIGGSAPQSSTMASCVPSRCHEAVFRRDLMHKARVPRCEIKLYVVSLISAKDETDFLQIQFTCARLKCDAG